MDENEDTTTANEEHVDQTDDAQDLPSHEELPDDPAELKRIAATAIQRLSATQQREADLTAEVERRRDSEEEQRTKATYWATDAEAKRNELADLRRGDKPAAKGKDAKPDDDDAFDQMEVATALTEGVTLGDISKRIEQRARKIAEGIVKQTTDNLSQQGAVANALTAEYPELRDQNSPLTKAAIAEMGNVEGEMGDAVRFEIATRRAAAKLGVAAKTNGKDVDKDAAKQKERERLRIAQGGPTLKATSGKGAIVITEADKAEARRMNGGQDVPLDVLKRAKTFQQEREQAQQSRA